MGLKGGLSMVPVVADFFFQIYVKFCEQLPTGLLPILVLNLTDSHLMHKLMYSLGYRPVLEDQALFRRACAKVLLITGRTSAGVLCDMKPYRGGNLLFWKKFGNNNRNWNSFLYKPCELPYFVTCTITAFMTE